MTTNPELKPARAEIQAVPITAVDSVVDLKAGRVCLMLNDGMANIAFTYEMGVRVIQKITDGLRAIEENNRTIVAATTIPKGTKRGLEIVVGK
jgi:hypothetical protein